MASAAGNRLYRAVLALLVIILVIAVAVPVPLAAQAAPTVPFAARFSADDNGTVKIFGNTLLTCPASDSRCAPAQAGTLSINNNSFPMTFIDADGDPSTTNSSSAVVSPPPDGEVLWAGLYWGARLSKGDGGAAGVGDRRTISFRTPGAAGYSQIRSQATFGPTTGDGAYQEFADVTGAVQAAGAGTYWAGNIIAGTGADRYAGWSLVVVYRAPSLPLRNLTVFDGFSDVGQGNPQTISLSGFRTPATGAVETELGMVAYEGDGATSGDTAKLNQTLLSTPLSRASNFFNSTDDDTGQNVTARTPAYANLLGYDIKNLAATGIPNGATSATVSLDSTGDRYFPGVVTTAIKLFAPDFTTSTKTAVNLAGRTPAFPDDEVEYTITYPNTGGDPATNAVMTDPLPPGTTFLSATPDRGTCSASGGTVTCAIGTIGVGDTWSTKLRVRVDASAAGTTLRNASSLDYTAQTLGRALTYVVAPAEIPVAALADLSITKTLTPDPIAAGQQWESLLTVHNAGPSTATSVVAADTFPAGSTGVDVQTPQGACTSSETDVSCELGAVASGATVVVRVRGTVPPGSADPAIVNTASVSSPTADPDPSNNATGASASVVRRADLSVTKTADTANPVPGQTVTYTVTTRNNGPSDAADVMMTDAVADSSVLSVSSATAAGASCTTAPDAARCTLGSLPAGASATMKVTTRVSPDAAAGQILSNSASATSATPDPNPANNDAVATVTTAAPSADLAITKTAGPISAGGTAQYTITVTNQGPSTSSNVRVSDVLPAGFTAQSATSSQGTCTGTTDVDCALGDLAGPDADGATASATITIVANVPADALPGPVSNTATVASDTADPTSANNTATVTATVAASADLSVTKTANPVQPAAGEDVVYTLDVTNAGPAVARDVTAHDPLPAGLTLVSVSAPSGVSCTGTTTLDCAIGTVGVGQHVQIAVTMHIPSSGIDLAAGVVNTVSVDSSTPDPVSGNDQATATITTRAVSDLGILKWDTTPGPPAPGTPPTTFTAGQTVTYRLAALNFGPSDASSARVIDTLPPGVTFVSAPAECAFTPPSTVQCDLPTVPNQFAAVFPIEVRIDPAFGDGQLTNTASIELTDPNRVDPSSGNNFAAVTNPVRAAADLSVTKQSFSGDPASPTSPAAASAGSAAGFFIDVRNDGPSTAAGVAVNDSADLTDYAVASVRLIKPGAAPVDITGQCTLGQGQFQCSLGDMPPLAAGEVWRLRVDGTILSSAAQGAYVNHVEVSTQTPDADPSNNAAQAPITVTAPVATLSIQKQIVDAPDIDGDGDADLIPGTPFTYRMTVAVASGADAPDVVMTDPLPAGLTPTSATSTQGACTITAGTVRCALGTLGGPSRTDPAPPVVITVSGTASSSLTLGTRLTNTATATSAISEPVSASASEDVVPVADIALAKTADAPQVAAGASIGFTLVATNAGPSDAIATQVGDLLPPELTFDPSASDPGCALVTIPEGTFVSCEIGTLAAGDSRTVRIVAQTRPDQVETTVTNVGAASSPVTGEFDFSNNRSTADVTIAPSADLSIAKTADTASPSIGGLVTFTLTTTNRGPSDASEVVVQDALPSGLALVSVTPPAGVTCTTGADIRCSQPTLPSGASMSIEVVARVPLGSAPGSLSNTATVRSATPDPDTSDNRSTAVVDSVAHADLSVEKSTLTPGPHAGQPVTFAIDVTNAGPQDAPAVVVSDTLRPGVTFVSARSPSGTCQVTHPEDADIVTCTGGSLAVGATERILVTVLPAADLTTLRNGALVGSAALDSSAADNFDEIDVPLAPPIGVTPTPTPTPTPSPSGTSTPGPSPSPSPTGSAIPTSGGLPATGGTIAWAAMAFGICALGAGIATLIMARRRTRP